MGANNALIKRKMKNFVDQFFTNIFELNFSLLMICTTIFLTVLGSKGCVNDANQDKLHQQYMVTCVNKGVPPAECALGWKTSRNP